MAPGAGGATKGSSSPPPLPPTPATTTRHHHRCVVWSFIKSLCVYVDTFSFSVALSFGSCSPRFFHTPCSLALSVTLFFSKIFRSPGSGSRSLPFRPPRPLGGARWRGGGGLGGRRATRPGGVERWRRARGRHWLGAAPSPPAAGPVGARARGARGRLPGLFLSRPGPGAGGGTPLPGHPGGASLRQLPPSPPPRPLPLLLLIPPPPPPSTPLAAAASSSPPLPPARRGPFG